MDIVGSKLFIKINSLRLKRGFTFIVTVMVFVKTKSVLKISNFYTRLVTCLLGNTTWQLDLSVQLIKSVMYLKSNFIYQLVKLRLKTICKTLLIIYKVNSYVT